MMADPAAFLAARLDEKEQRALGTPPDRAEAEARIVLPWLNEVAPLVPRDEVALREVAAMRAILADHIPADHWCARPPDPDWVVYEAGQRVVRTYPCGTTRDLLAAYSDHPDYDQDLKP